MFRDKSDAKAAALCIFDLSVFAAASVVVVVGPSIWIKCLSGLVMGVWIARLFIIGHDACHQAFFNDRRLNRWIGRLVFLPSLTTYSLWEAGHNLGHHVYTNLKGYDYVWTPMSKASYDAMPAWQRVRERLYRSGFGYWAYYGIELWWKKLFFPGRDHVPTRSVSFTRDSVLVAVFGVLWIGMLIGAAVVTGQSAGLLLSVGFVLPFFVWNLLMGSVIYFHHTHPDVVWYDDLDEWEAARDGVTGTVLITLPFKGGRLLNNIMEHPAHHLDVRIPLYNIEAAQSSLSQGGAELLEQPLTWRHIVDCTRRCKLYDYDAHRWTDFDGKISGAVAQPLPLTP